MKNKIISKWFIVSLFSLITTVAVFGQSRKPAPTPVRLQPRAIPKLLKGVTLEDVQAPNPAEAEEQRQYRNKIQPLLESLRNFAGLNACSSQSCLSTRIVFDFKSGYKLPKGTEKYQNAFNYRQLVDALHQPDINSIVLGEILDSQPFEDCSLDCYKKRVDNYLTNLPAVDIWEVGNEVNGEWTGDINKSIAKINYAADEVKRRGGMTELTLYYNIGCRKKGDKYELDKWLDDSAPKLHADKIDYILLSYYENQCDNNPGRRPTDAEWEYVFDKIRSKFRPDVFIGFGETGIGDNEDGTTPPFPKEHKVGLIKHYYETVQNHFASHPKYRDKYIGGYYWWQFKADMVPFSEDKTSLWQTLNDSWKNW